MRGLGQTLSSPRRAAASPGQQGGTAAVPTMSRHGTAWHSTGSVPGGSAPGSSWTPHTACALLRVALPQTAGEASSAWPMAFLLGVASWALPFTAPLCAWDQLQREGFVSRSLAQPRSSGTGTACGCGVCNDPIEAEPLPLHRDPEMRLEV